MIRFLVTGQQLSIVTPIVVADTINYLSAEAVFRGEEWEPCTKWAHFLRDEQHYTVPFHGDAITAEQGLNLTAGTWQVYIHGNYYDPETDTVTVRITTGTALLKVEAAELSDPFPPVTPELAEVLAAEVENALAVAEGVRQDAAAGTFNGATFTPMLSADGILSFRNDKGLPNPAAQNVRGMPGESGKDFAVLGFFQTLDALRYAITDPKAGDAYGIGTSNPYTIFIYDGANDRWVNNGTIQGAKGDPGTAATIRIGNVRTAAYSEGAIVSNSGTETDVILNFAIPQGKTPVKGTDYWTDADKQSIASYITPQMIGAITEPVSKSNGDVLKWNGSTWIAGVPTQNGVLKVNGKTGEVSTRLFFPNETIPTSAFTLQTTPAYPDFPYVASKSLDYVTAQMVPEVTFSVNDAISGNYAPVAETYGGGVYIYARTAPEENLTIPLIQINI